MSVLELTLRGLMLGFLLDHLVSVSKRERYNFGRVLLDLNLTKMILEFTDSIELLIAFSTINASIPTYKQTIE
jgi:hypothetical protein